jgi:hypothetical protein
MRKLILFLLLCSAASAQPCDPNTNSLRFSGGNYVKFPPNNDLNISGDITVEAWIKIAAFTPNYVQGSIVCKHGWTQGEKGYVLRCGGNGYLAFAIAGINNSGNAVSWKEAKSGSGKLQLNTWHHVAGTYDGHKIKLYIDGDQVASKNFSGSIDPSIDYDLKVGRIADNNTVDKRFFDGWIDDVRIWNDALSESDIQAGMNEQISGSSNHLVAYWKFNEGSGTTVDDVGSTTSQGTIVGALWDVDVPYTNGILRPTITEVAGSLISSSLIGNQWNVNGVPIPGETGISFTPTTGGIYTVTTNYGLGCSATSDAMELIISGIQETQSQFALRNFNSKVFQFITDAQISKNAFVKVHDLSGREIYFSNRPFDPIDLSDDQPGLYVITLTIERNQNIIKVFVQ